MTDTLAAQIEALADKIDVQAQCLEHYAENDGHSGKAPGSVYHWQATHFRDIATELRNLPAIVTALRQAEAAPGVVEAVQKCREQFAFYTREHLAAGKNEKAETNQRFVTLCDDALHRPDLLALARQHGAREGMVLVPKSEIETLALLLDCESRPSSKAWGKKLRDMLYAAPATDVGEV